MNLDSLSQLKERWWTRRHQITLAVAAVLLLLALLGPPLTRRVTRRGWPQTSGQRTVDRLSRPVTVVRDRYGVPHLYAETPVDLYLAQGYVHAQDRFWQMELNRRRARGSLATALGERAKSSDALYQELDLVAAAQTYLAQLDEDAWAALAAYTVGVNAWLAEHRGRLPFEFTLSRWRGRAIEPAEWTVEDTLLLTLALRWQVQPSTPHPSLIAHLVDRVGAERAAELLGREPTWDNAKLGDLETVVPPPLSGDMLLGVKAQRVPGSLTQNGRALLSIDLPTDLSLPSPWHLVALHVGEQGALGVSSPGLPGLWVGQGDLELASWGQGPAVTLLAGETPVFCLLPLSFEGLSEAAPPTLDALWAHQLDTTSARAARLIPYLLQVQPQGWRQERVSGMLETWDYRTGDREFPFFAVYQLELARAAFADELGNEVFEAYVARGDFYQAALDRILDNPDAAWWDDVSTPQRELRGDILQRAYEPALEWIGRNYGDLHMLWEWDLIHGSQLYHLLGNAWPWDQLLNRDFAPQGWTETANASPGGLPCTGGLCWGGDFYRVRGVYGYRQLFDASDPDTLWFMLLPGQSGHPFHPHYADLLDEWLDGEYLPLQTADSPDRVPGGKETLILSPE